MKTIDFEITFDTPNTLLKTIANCGMFDSGLTLIKIPPREQPVW